MATPSLVNLFKKYSAASITIIGSRASVELIKEFPNVNNYFITSKKYNSNIKLIKKVRSLNFETFISFRSSIRTTLMSRFFNIENKFQFDKNKYKLGHQVEKYNSFIANSIGITMPPGPLFLGQSPCKKIVSENKKIGINPGAAYGSAKRWTFEGFCEVALQLSKEYDIVLFGGNSEIDICNDIEKILNNHGRENITNLAGKTSITELMREISNIDLFITGDSGPMHIAAAFQIPTISIFGPTKHLETSQWMNNKSVLIRKDLDCQPCMKRECPLGHHQCMELIMPEEVIAQSLNLI